MPESTSLYWLGHYPHNKIASGLNQLLKRRGLPFKIEFDRKKIDGMVTQRGGAVSFNYVVQAELAEAARQFAEHGLTLYLEHNLLIPNGKLTLTLDAEPVLPESTRVVLQPTPGQNDLDAIWINCLSYDWISSQRDYVSGALSMNYDLVDEMLARRDPAIQAEFRKELKQPPPRAPLVQGSWFAIMRVTTAPRVEVWMPNPPRTEMVRVYGPDLHLFTRVFPQALQYAVAEHNLQLVQLSLSTKSERSFRLVLPADQALELIAALEQLLQLAA